MNARRLTGKPRPVQSRPSLLETKADLLLRAVAEGGEQIELLDALLTQCGLDRSDPDRWFWLSLRLAQQYVPDFRRERGPRGQATTTTRRPRGARERPSGLQVDALAAAYVEIEKSRLGSEQAARRYLRQKGAPFARYPDSTLRDMAKRGQEGGFVYVAQNAHGDAWPERLIEVLGHTVNLDE